MTERIIEIEETAVHLSLENGLLKIQKDHIVLGTVPVSEIQCLVLANPAVTVTGALLSALAENGCITVVAGKNRMPSAMQLPLECNYRQTEHFHAQASAKLPLKKRLWQSIVSEKIRSQANLLLKLHQSDFGLMKISDHVLSGDAENAESRAAVVYWKSLFTVPFRRDRDALDSNLLLNYGYGILRAMAARACCAAGLHPSIGVNHHNRYNAFCLADDIMEPFRSTVDACVVRLNPENNVLADLSKDQRYALISSLLNEKIVCSDKTHQKITDMLLHSAQMIAKSFERDENCLSY